MGCLHRKGFCASSSTHHHFGPHPDTLLFFSVTSGPRFTKKVGANELLLKQSTITSPVPAP
jgi:hypothetical protein